MVRPLVFMPLLKTHTSTKIIQKMLLKRFSLSKIFVPFSVKINTISATTTKHICLKCSNNKINTYLSNIWNVYPVTEANLVFLFYLFIYFKY